MSVTLCSYHTTSVDVPSQPGYLDDALRIDARSVGKSRVAGVYHHQAQVKAISHPQWTMIDAVNRWIDSEPLERYGERYYKDS